jgi:hypothetical protein
MHRPRTGKGHPRCWSPPAASALSGGFIPAHTQQEPLEGLMALHPRRPGKFPDEVNVPHPKVSSATIRITVISNFWLQLSCPAFFESATLGFLPRFMLQTPCDGIPPGEIKTGSRPRHLPFVNTSAGSQRMCATRAIRRKGECHESHLQRNPPGRRRCNPAPVRRFLPRPRIRRIRKRRDSFGDAPGTRVNRYGIHTATRPNAP